MSARVDFYIQGSDQAQQRLILACQIAGKAYRAGQRVHLHCRDQAQLNTLDELLWSLRDEAFFAHDSQAPYRAPITLGHSDDAPKADVLINLAPNIPVFVGQFPRIMELLNQEPEVIQSGRENYRHYRQQGYDLHSHNL